MTASERTDEPSLIGLADFGSTFTKLRVATSDGRLVASTQHPTVHANVLDGLESAREQIASRLGATGFGRTLACSSAGGGLRMAVVGLERDLTVEAARQAALSAGARVTTVLSNGLADEADAVELLQQDPDIVLLVGGTNGGDEATLIRSATALSRIATGHVPVVIAGNEAVQGRAATELRSGGWTVALAPNVMPTIRSIQPEGVRDVVRRLFIDHVIGGKLGGGDQLADLVHMATPDAVLRGTELLARLLAQRGVGTGLIVVDVGGATTDVHSVLVGRRPPRGYKRGLLPQPLSARSVEADLGVRWNARGILESACEAGLLNNAQAAELIDSAISREQDPTYLADTDRQAQVDRRLTSLAIALAVRRHVGRERLTLTPDGTVLERRGRDLTEASIIVGTGGAVQALPATDLEDCLRNAAGSSEPLLLPRRVHAELDSEYLLAAAGLLATINETAAVGLLTSGMAGLFNRLSPHA